MSLFKQLWIAIAAVMLLAFGMSAVLSVLSARDYLQAQLQTKNRDNANMLALSLTQMEKDPVTVELQVASQFDAGYYDYIRIVSPKGEKITERVFSGTTADAAPAWFVGLIPIKAEPGQALIQDGWKQFGTVQMASQTSYVYKSLWDGTLDLLVGFLIGIVVIGVLGRLALQVITKPLNDVVKQADAIADRHFLTIAEPRTPELKSVAVAMNSMVSRLKAMFAEEAARLEALRQKVNRDTVTGLSSRDYFLSHLREALTGEQFPALGSLVVVRLADLNLLNTKLGRKEADALLKSCATVLYNSGTGRVGQRAGRLKGTEFAVVCPTLENPADAAADIHQRLLAEWAPQWLPAAPDLFHVGAVGYVRDQPLGELLTQADEALARATSQDANTWFALPRADGRVTRTPDQWRQLIADSLSSNRFEIVSFPVVKGPGLELLHSETSMRLRLPDGSVLSAGDFVPQAEQLQLLDNIDVAVMRIVLQTLPQMVGDVAVNLSAQSLGDAAAREQIVRDLHSSGAAARRILIEVPEYGVFRQFDAFRELARTLKGMGVKVGIEYFGQRFTEGEKLASLGLDYIKVHPSYIRGIGTNTGNQDFLQGLCKAAQGLGIQVIALGVEREEDLALLKQLGFDGATGPGVKRSV
jgi:EAL domain-containing protein (putative c-di-GMP-specific phosphodiesterase class I)/GGDEF domain-containing protein